MDINEARRLNRGDRVLCDDSHQGGGSAFMNVAKVLGTTTTEHKNIYGVPYIWVEVQCKSRYGEKTKHIWPSNRLKR